MFMDEVFQGDGVAKFTELLNLLNEMGSASGSRAIDIPTAFMGAFERVIARQLATIR